MRDNIATLRVDSEKQITFDVSEDYHALSARDKCELIGAMVESLLIVGQDLFEENEEVAKDLMIEAINKTVN